MTDSMMVLEHDSRTLGSKLGFTIVRGHDYLDGYFVLSAVYSPRDVRNNQEVNIDERWFEEEFESVTSYNQQLERYDKNERFNHKPITSRYKRIFEEYGLRWTA